MGDHEALPALSEFAFLVGSWQCDARLKTADDTWQVYRAAWLGRFILDGHAIADEYRMMDRSGALLVFGMNIRTYDASRRVWNIRWLNALGGDWTNLVSDELGGVMIDPHDRSIAYVFREPAADHAYTRATYSRHSATHFTWRGDRSDDGKSWQAFMIVEAFRNQ